jgi:hypothetical protein
MRKLAVIIIVVAAISLLGSDNSYAGGFERRDHRKHDRHEITYHFRTEIDCDRHVSWGKRSGFEDYHLIRHHDNGRRDRDRDDYIVFRSDTVVLPLLLPPLPPPLVFPGMRIRIISTR